MCTPPMEVVRARVDAAKSAMPKLMARRFDDCAMAWSPAMPSAVSISASNPMRLCAASQPDLRDQHVHSRRCRQRRRLWDQDHVQPAAGFDDVDHVAVHVMRVEPVDAHHHGLAAPVDVVEGGNDVPARLFLVVGRHGIFAIQNTRGRQRSARPSRKRWVFEPGTASSDRCRRGLACGMTVKPAGAFPQQACRQCGILIDRAARYARSFDDRTA